MKSCVLERYLLDYEIQKVRQRMQHDRAWRYLLKNIALPVSDVAVNFGLTAGSFRSWIQSNHPGEVSRLRRLAGLPPRKPL